MNALRRIAWDAANVSASNAVTALTQLLETVVLARLLSPDNLGTIAIIAVIIGFIRSVADVGVGNALLHFQELPRAVFSSLYLLLLALGVAIFALSLLCPPLVAAVGGGSLIAPLCGWIGLGFLLTPIGSLYQFILQKNLRFKRLSFVESAARCAGTATVVLLAIRHWGVLSFVIGQVVYCGVKSLLLLVAGYRLMPLSFTFDMAAARSHLRFGLFQMGERVIVFFSSNIDYMIIGKFLGTRELGFYKIAYELVTVPLRLINPIFATVTLPRFAKNQNDDAALRTGIVSLLHLLSLVTFPLLFGLAATAKVFIPVVYGPGWEPTAVLVWLLTGMGLVKVVGNVSGTMIVAKGCVKTGLVWNIIIAVGNTLTFFSAVRYGAIALSAAYSAISFVYLLASFKSYYGATIGLRLPAYLRSFTPPLLLSLGMAVIVAGLYVVLAATGMKPPLLLSILVGVGGAVYLATGRLFDRKGLSEIAGVLGKRGVA
jgi:O-antigen/teichoic acid export membrane protein